MYTNQSSNKETQEAVRDEEEQSDNCTILPGNALVGPRMLDEIQPVISKDDKLIDSDEVPFKGTVA